ncbi:hypothetical protein [Pendulispora albinea]|uniref:YtxH domain-containing protein n=1 Tax=Pendulispora albinea TaxID=2741071 RepID=A0ABZ2M9J7_9BACT
MGKKKKKKRNGSKGANGAANADAESIALGTKLQYVGVGVVLGVVAAPAIRKWLERARPEVDKLLERLTAQAEELAENAGDWMATARGRISVKDEDGPSGRAH